MRYYVEDGQGLITIREGEFDIIDGKAHQVYDGGTAKYGQAHVGTVELYGWPDTICDEYEGGLLIPRSCNNP